MQATSWFLIFVFAAFLITSCNTFRVAGAPTFGRTQDISIADIEAAVAAYQKSQLRLHSDATVGQIEVISHDEVRLYWGEAGGSYDTMKRVNGRWQDFRGAVILE